MTITKVKSLPSRWMLAMKLSFSLLERAGTDLGIVLAVLLAGLLSSPAASGQNKPSPFGVVPQLVSQQVAPQKGNAQTPSVRDREDFQNSMMRNPPTRKGCFTAQYPAKAWKEVQCVTTPPLRFPHAKVTRAGVVGSGNDFVAEVSGNISSATGSFDSVTGMNSEYGFRGFDSTTVYSDTYSLQLNSNDFSTPFCKGCTGFQQYIFDQGSQCYPLACTYIQYWLFNASSCPAGWTPYDGSGGGAPGCFVDSPFAPVPIQPPSGLRGLRLIGLAGGTDTSMVLTANGDVHASHQESILDLAHGWNDAEFNLFGECCGSEAYFTSSSTLTIRLNVNSGTTDAPTCVTPAGFTKESNNLILGSASSCSMVGGASPAIVFPEGGYGPLPPGVTIGGLLWSSLGGSLSGNAGVGKNADGRLEVFVRSSTRGELLHNYQLSTGGWSGWSSLAGNLFGDPVVGQNKDGRLEVFARGSRAELIHIYQLKPNGGEWSDWRSLGGSLSGPVVGQNPVVGQDKDGRLEVFARSGGGNGELRQIYQLAPNGATWSGWSSLASNLFGDPVVGQNKDGRLEVFWRDSASGELNHIYQLSTGGWSGPNSLGGDRLSSDASVGQNASGQLEVFVRGSNGDLLNKNQLSTGGWSGWSSLGGNLIGEPVVAQNADGRLEVFWRDSASGELNHIYQLSTGGWSGWSSLGVSLPGGLFHPVVGLNADGQLEVFTRGMGATQLELLHVHQPLRGLW
jgi:hypothetical protein